MEDKDNGSGDLPLQGKEQNEKTLTQGEQIIMKKLEEMEGRLRTVETPRKREDSAKSEAVKTQVNSGEPVLFEMEDGFLYVAPGDYEGPICSHCHMPPLDYCTNGVVGVDHDTRKIQMNPNVPKSCHIACPQKKKWRDVHEPLLAFSKNETELPPPSSIVPKFQDSENGGGPKDE